MESRIDAKRETKKNCLNNQTDMQSPLHGETAQLHQSFHHILALTQESMEKSKSSYKLSEV